MDFCKESTHYVSLYIDDMLEESTKREFEKHMNECDRCAEKVKEALALVELLRESDDIMLPQKFSSSLHNRLVEVAENQKENKGKLFIYNKKLIAGLSTAAVLVVSLLAYSLLPQTPHNRQMTSISADITAPKEVKDSTKDANVSGKESTQESTQKSTQESNTQTGDIYVTQPSSDKLAADNSSTTQHYTKKRVFEKKDENKALLKSSKSTKKTDEESKEKTESVYKTKIAEQTISLQYFTNTAEMTLNSALDKENEDEALKGLMLELGGNELTSDDETIVIMTQKNYIDYVIPLDSFTKIQQLAYEKYNLELSIKLPVTKENITEQYKELEKQMDELTEKINDMEIKGNDTLILEKERNNLSQKMDEIIKNNGMITIRIFFEDK
ncbi:anti-sigma factor family protein [Ruminiclostridium cellulolyticum]|uniref:Anti-sigma-W factor RsiW n=1 Tax=Ruminiclostridium cellulolyticum (strain ATCC 35319 / DSM 5812 / JCM 6584 / H10) TaxID=394503 RepID=B8I3Y8_RUMCH|nr:zf-HC2 domain-containing protein [Ruminiclostridium cellulolyticum]ACL76421.1 putative transmembrane anti-sigma factor [Ruminiclostridium cellulolyticum H10]